MPLSNNTSLSLQVSSNAVQSKPKCAMIVRMSAETLDALEAFPNHPQMSFDFGDVPGIYIGDTFFPMQPQKESSPHELFLRAASSVKPMAPLKLYANVIGKFRVERQLGDKVTGKVRQQTMVAKQQHMERRAILLDQPPIPGPGPKNAKRKTPGSGTVLKKTPPSDHLRFPPRKLSPLPQNTPSSKASADVRRRLVHFLAISPRLADDAVKMVGGASISNSARDDLLALLDDVAEQQSPPKKGDKSPRPWTLKPQSWTEVRPFEWPKLTEAGRIAMARQARMAFQALRIPESDPAWENVRYRPTAPTNPTSVPVPPPMTATNSTRSSASAQAETKRSGITTKDSKLKSKQDAPRQKGEIQMKDESTKATASRVNAIKREADRPSTPSDSGSGSKTIASRRLPGSGYQAKKSPQPSLGVTEKSGTPVDPRTAPKPSLPASLPQKPFPAVPTTAGSHARKTIPKPVKKEDESDREYERQREREREKREREKEQQREEWERVEMEKRERARQKEREATEREKRQREKVREQEEKRQRERDRIAKERAAGDAVPVFKRKTATQNTEETPDDASSKVPLPKRRKLDDGTSVASSSSKVRDAGLPAPKRPAHEPSPAPRLKIKKEPSPSQASISNQERSAGGSTHKSERSSRVSGSAKPRRRSPIYTSSEDEGEIPQPRKRNPSPPPISDRSNSSDQPQTERTQRHQRTPRAAYPPSTDHASLRALYQSQYSTYLGAFSKVVAQKRKIEAMLNGDSEAEADVLDPDDLVKLSMEHKSLKTELENIHDIYTKGTVAGAAASTGATGGSSAASD